MSFRNPLPFLIAVTGFVATAMAPTRSDAIDIIFDYSYDTGNFFGSAGSAQRLALEEAASFFETTFVDNLEAITPGGGNSWSATFFDPTNSGSTVSETNLVIPEDAIYIFVGSEDRGIDNLGLAAPGGYNISAVTQEFVDSIVDRGQDGVATNTDFGPWGGALSFNDNNSIDWSFDTVNGPASDEYDFKATAMHEIAHVLGFSIADSFTTQIVGDEFTGAFSVAENGGNVLLTPDGHVDSSQMSTVFGGGATQVPLMADTAGQGDQLEFTELDVAMLQDTGWEVVPEPGSALLFVGGGALLLFRRRRRAVSQN